LRSRPIADLVKETSYLEQQGVRELSLIAQDLTAYGNDLGNSVHLTALLKSLLAESNMPWLRLMYLYPSGIDEELLSLMAEQPRIVPYLDVPFQHVSDTVLKRMNRPYTGDFLYELIARIRSYLPDVALRSTFMVGFPGETDADIRQLEQFLKEARLDHVGVFAYANEAGCPSENFPHQCSDVDKQERLDFIVSVQAEVSAENLKRYVGRVEPVLVEGVSRETDLLLEGRTRFQAPDIDGCVYITDGEAKPGDIVQVRISEAQVYDLVGEITG
jgi:ribosomal protein S12 methylthiotransferase